jgi:hypothetical protein
MTASPTANDRPPTVSSESSINPSAPRIARALSLKSETSGLARRDHDGIACLSRVPPVGDQRGPGLLRVSSNDEAVALAIDLDGACGFAGSNELQRIALPRESCRLTSDSSIPPSCS